MSYINVPTSERAVDYSTKDDAGYFTTTATKMYLNTRMFRTFTNFKGDIDWDLFNTYFDMSKVTEMNNTFNNCKRLTEAVCGPKVTQMPYAYIGCTSLTKAACGDKVTNMDSAYLGCTSLTEAVCGDKVTYMIWTYYGCTSLTKAACGPEVTCMNGAYSGCTSLTEAVCGPKVTSMGDAYGNCPYIQGNLTLPNGITYASNMFNRTTTSDKLNIFLYSGTMTNGRINDCASYSITTSSAKDWDNAMGKSIYIGGTYTNIDVYYIDKLVDAGTADQYGINWDIFPTS